VTLNDFINSIVVAGLAAGSIYALIALGFNAMWKSVRVLNFAYGDLVMWAPMAALVARQVYGLPTVIALIIGLAVPVILGLACEITAIRRYVTQPNNYSWILSTLAVSIILEQLASIPFNAQPQSFPYAVSGRVIKLGVITTTPQNILVIVVAPLLTVAVILFYKKTAIGKMLTAFGEDTDGAIVLGISRSNMSRVSMLISAGVAAISGLVLAPLFLITPTFGFGFVFAGFVAVAFGGLGSFVGGLIGGLVIGFLSQITAATVGAEWTDAVLFGTLLAVYLVRPTGLLGTRPVRTV
jgi:branched-chain amino acid transport system permease protein